ncbi:hypothetical protein GPL17_09805 [Bradyrhizobium yuanmingense]|uniref:hypothetical protein n=1 Tax=Bradyrhizobium TaxID=374 RepID=UPI0012FB6E31|nr:MULTISPECIES: hypothetical protein [Bradyrhizobium]MDA9548997.1 hypothetical protein [Bradyrhizobium sp. CCBAU 45321]MDF0493587.1 hypothetical protein [Bradyrhizobium yuanmingense]MDF0582681.1 hypothetical protein [Bradyrhizobium yuanmingense]MVT50784.1 hypothetical protein [Bradyrhizobium yuanmingense]
MFDSLSKFVGRKAVLATAAVVALTAVAPSASYAGGRHWHRGGGGAAAAAMFGLAATGLAIAASRNAYAYDPGPVYYYEGGPAYYSGPGYGPYYYDSGNRYTYGGYKNPCAHGYSGYSCY